MRAEIEWEVPGGGAHCWEVYFEWDPDRGALIHEWRYHVGPGDRWAVFPEPPYLNAAAWEYVHRECETVWLDDRDERLVEAHNSGRGR